jgi:hypothetical protein
VKGSNQQTGGDHMATQREQKDEKELTQQLLRYQGQDYQDWLHEKHEEFNRENSDVFKKLLTKAIKEKEKPKVEPPIRQEQEKPEAQETNQDQNQYEGVNA